MGQDAPVLEHAPSPPIDFADCIGFIYCTRCGTLLSTHLAGVAAGASRDCRITCPLSLHSMPADAYSNSGHWVFGFTTQELLRMANVAVQEIPLGKYKQERTHFAQIAEQLNGALLVHTPDVQSGVWVAGFTALELWRLANIAVLEVPLDKYPQDWTRMGRLARQINDQLMAQKRARIRAMIGCDSAPTTT